MVYEEYLKEKIINLYLINQKIGKHSVTEIDFQFLNQYFNIEIKPNIYTVSQLLQEIIQDYKLNYILKI